MLSRKIPFGAYIALAVLLISCLLATPVISQETDSPVPQSDLAKLFDITWRRGPDLPQGFQDSDGGIIAGRLVTVGGFCSGGMEIDNQRKPGVYPRGFLNKGWVLDLADGASSWQPLPDFPGAARQGLSAAKVDGELYVWGGFSYTSPYCYADGWKLSFDNGKWQWTRLPNLPHPLASVALTVIGTKIYAFGGADYNAEAFFTDNDRHGRIERMGAQCFVFDTQRLEFDAQRRDQSWKKLTACPGTPRWVHAAAAVDGKIYVIGGASGHVVRDGRSYGYCTVVDNWVYSPDQDKWSRLRDLPISSGNFPRSSQLVFQDRYILLPGGYQYGSVLNPDGTIRDKYGQPTSANPKTGLYNNFFVYDTKTDLFGSADALPLDNNLPMTVVRENEIFMVGGETGGGVVEGDYYGHHPELLLIGTISPARIP